MPLLYHLPSARRRLQGFGLVLSCSLVTELFRGVPHGGDVVLGAPPAMGQNPVCPNDGVERGSALHPKATAPVQGVGLL